MKLGGGRRYSLAQYITTFQDFGYGQFCKVEALRVSLQGSSKFGKARRNICFGYRD